MADDSGMACPLRLVKDTCHHGPYVVVDTHMTYFATKATQEVGHLLYDSWQGSLHSLLNS